ncbi:hypothetical protein QMK33_21985 [Hymenobacter sp. H14-R3]|uniref:hypothetical protein n=1 Tax=Hymenobacter sp. H14-R3 TaxID=3046308 RepID=UPI0024BA145C|nr:hypothetical protein [Hymenobacter sp. H14-R3]MDJ0367824.1 hypothetical protein [Hymenobacter sp. H14-R3]
MSYRRDLKYLRRAQKQAKRQMNQLDQLEVSGLTAITLHTHGQQVTITLAAATGTPFTDTLREALRERQPALQAKAQQLLLIWLAEEQLRDQPTPAAESALP